MPRQSVTIALAGLALTAASTAGALDLITLDRGLGPCPDFYGYANRGWIQSTTIPDDRSRWGTTDQLDERNEKILVGALEAARAKPLPAPGTAQRKVIEFYASGMDRAAIDKAGLHPIEPLMARAAGVEDAASLAAALALLHRGGVDAGFAFTVSPDAKDSGIYLAQVLQGGLGLPDRDYYFLPDARSADTRAAYTKHVKLMFTLAGDTPEAAARNAAAVVALETELARASMTAVERRDVDKTYNKLSAAKLAEDAPGFPWRVYFTAIGAPDLAQMNVAQPAFMTGFARMAADRPAADWRAYLRWQVLRATATKLPEAFEHASFDFYQATLQGRKAQAPRPRQVIDAIGGRYGTEPMGQALSMIFVERAFPPEAKARAEAMVGYIKAALDERLRSVEWMGDETRARALEKLAAMRVKVGYPDRWRDFTDADVGDYSFAENWMRAKAFIHRRNVARIGQAVDRSEWNTSPHIVNAFYNGSGNEIVFPAGILQPPFFDAHADDAVNYGAIGMVIGHEITHGFDDRGRRFDAAGNMRDWWTAADAGRYLERAARVERQYSAFIGVDDMPVNGKLTLGENISDVGGVKIAYLALAKALRDKPHEKTLDGLTPEQRFFLSFAQAWRTRYRPQYERLLLRTDAHSPPRFRVAGVVANMPEFAQAFGCDASHTLLSESARANIW
jgi:predicted metalloendopeptidase